MMTFETPRLRLRSWTHADRSDFAALNADPEVMRDLGGPLDRRRSDEKLDRYIAAYEQHGYCRWAIENLRGEFVGYAGILPLSAPRPLGDYLDLGWRLKRAFWGNGYATEAARTALDDGLARIGMAEICAVTASDNIRSQAVIRRLGLERFQECDYALSLEAGGAWQGQVWRARQPSRRRIQQ